MDWTPSLSSINSRTVRRSCQWIMMVRSDVVIIVVILVDSCFGPSIGFWPFFGLSWFFGVSSGHFGPLKSYSVLNPIFRQMIGKIYLQMLHKVGK